MYWQPSLASGIEVQIHYFCCFDYFMYFHVYKLFIIDLNPLFTVYV